MPHLSHDLALAELVPLTPHFVTMKLTKLEHQGVSSSSTLRLVVAWYSNILSLLNVA